MKRTVTILSFIVAVPMYLFMTAYNSPEAAHRDGNRESAGMWSNTGSPGDGGETCAACHTQGGVTVEDTWITTDIPGTGYVAGQSYSITLTTAGGSPSTNKGFSVTVENGANAPTGTLSATDATNTSYFDNHVTHRTAGITQTAWTVGWTAPAQGTGDVTVYAAFVKNGYAGGVATASLSVAEASVGVSEVGSDDMVSIFPNPVSDMLRIELPSAGSGTVSVDVYSITGQMVLNDNVVVGGDRFSISYDLSDLNVGTYLVRLTHSGKVYTERIVVSQ
ncbi:MAG: T9SS type A sorting domain-containing protein [Flavobacteriales bacterium]|nr:T9SS type A sorting domain-containing protein [Flavobacteriales bacterium]